MPAADHDLDAIVRRIEGLAEVEAEPVSYSESSHTPAEWREAARRWAQVMETLSNAITRFAWLETKSGGHTVAYTVVTHGCDVQTLWNGTVSADAARRHQTELWHTVQRRSQLLRVLLASIRSMTAISAAYANPVFSIAAIRQAWKLAQEITLLLEQDQSLAELARETTG